MITLALLAMTNGIYSTVEPAAYSIESIHLRDPFILPVREDETYYLFGTGWKLPNGPGFMCYHSRDLKEWQGPTVVFQYTQGFWSNRDYWAPEVHKYKGKYYMFASFKADGIPRGTQILMSDKPDGRYQPITDGPVTPEGWECLDGTMFIDHLNQPWMVFCHEWVQVGDGEMCAIQLSDDLKNRIGEPILLFRASEASWVVEIGGEKRGKVTDGPFLHRTKDGTLLMLWSSFGKSGYHLAIAISESGKLEGPWKHPQVPLYTNDGGHGMLFRTFEDKLCLILHQPNHGAPPIPTIMEARERDGMIELVDH
jgi:beta-xylosidase